jgi:subtilisin family serine protease
MMLRQRTKWITFALIVMMLFIAVTPVTAAPKDTVRVWVSYQSGKKAEVFQALDKAKAQLHYDFPELEAYVVTLPEAALNGIIHNPFVTDVEVDPVRYAIDPVQVAVAPGPDDTVDVNGQVVPWGIDAVQAREVWDADYDAVVDEGAPDGSGITVCIIDTGYYAGHEDLMDNATGLSQVDDDYLRDGAGHGSHVAGTISALNNSIGVVGVTPGTVNLTIVKIFNDDGVWTTASNLVNAIYTCRDNGADVISMSLGGSSSSRKEQRAFDTLYAGGILSIAAAGNEQEETPGAYEYPGSYDSVVSVAAVDSALNVADFSQQNDQVEIAGPGVGVLSTIPYVDTNIVNVAGVDYSANHIEFSALGTVSGALVDGGLCTATGAWAGQVVLCQRGDISFYDKVMNVQNSGGAAAIVYNNEPGNFLGTLGDGASSSIIGVSLSQEDGQYLVANELGTVASITSTHDWPASGYEAWDGTSMATPHVSAVAALVWSANPAWTNVEIREALNATAIDLGAAGRDSIYGYGLVQAAAALEYLSGGVTPPPPPPPTGALSVSIDSPAPTAVFSNRAKVAIEISVADDNGAVSGAAVSVVVTGATGVSTSYSGVTGSDGSVSFTFKVNTGLYGKGTYTIDATATMDGYDPGSASGSFIVQ